MLKNFDNVACLFQRVFPKSVRCFSGIPADVIGEWMPQTWGLRPKRARKCRKKCGNGGGETRRMGLESAEVRHGNIRTFPFKHPYILTPTFEVPAEMPERPIEKGGAEVAFFPNVPPCVARRWPSRRLICVRKRAETSLGKASRKYCTLPFFRASSSPFRPAFRRVRPAKVRHPPGVFPACLLRMFRKTPFPPLRNPKKSTATLLTDCRTFKCMLSLPVMETQGFS